MEVWCQRGFETFLFCFYFSNVLVTAKVLIDRGKKHCNCRFKASWSQFFPNLEKKIKIEDSFIDK